MRPTHDLSPSQPTSPKTSTLRTKVSQGSVRLLCIMIMGLSSLTLQSGCDTGFGQSCKLPEGDVIQQVCSAPQVQEGDEGNTMQSANATCALDNFPGCDTFLCLKYRGGNPYCSLRCNTSADCGDGICCPLVGDCRGNTGGDAMLMSMDPQASATQNTCANDDCYCIRKSDLNR